MNAYELCETKTKLMNDCEWLKSELASVSETAVFCDEEIKTVIADIEACIRLINNLLRTMSLRIQ